MSAANPPTNRLSAESSPYLRQHQHNPVDWYPWGPEAFEAARRLNRPIFLSVGYSTCYWCHVMERQCFENEAIAAEMNRRFISIKVDREERPDVDQLYMTAVQLLTRQGGWPMSVFLTRDLRPFYGGTYFPPTDQYGRPGFPTLLRALDDAWHTRRADVEASADHLVDALRHLAEPSPSQQPIAINSAWIERLIHRSISDYDPRHGGFGGAPKFPRQTLLELLLAYSDPTSRTSEQGRKVHEMVLHTLDALARGGIHDHLGGGFHRYSTDAHWLVPHFEIMLYDNAMLAWCYVEAFRQTGDARWSAVARGIFDFVLREMTSPSGAFYTAFDAEVDAMEGASYLWTRAEVMDILANPSASPAQREDAELFSRVYGLDDGPNFADPHHGNGTPDKNVLFLPRAIEDVAIDLKIDPASLQSRLVPLGKKLLDARAARKQPSLDTKILTSWNALMIRAFAHGGIVLQAPEYVAAAERAASFLLENHLRPDGMLPRTTGGLATSPPSPRPPIPGFLDDYAFLAQALLAISESGNADQWKAHASRIIDQMIARFGDTISSPGGSALFHSPGNPAFGSEAQARRGEGQGGGRLAGDSSNDKPPITQTPPPPQSSPGVAGEEAIGIQAAKSLRSRELPCSRGFFFTDAAAKELIVRQKTATDSPLPSGNGVAAMVLLATGRIEAARETLAAFAASIEAQGESMSAMVKAAMRYVDQAGAFVVAPQGQSDATARPQSPEQGALDVVSVSASRENDSLLHLRLTIAPGWHINAHDVSSAVPLVPTTLQIPGKQVSVEYPAGEEQTFPFADQPLRVYSGDMTLAVKFTGEIPADSPLELTLTYQPCDDSTCLPAVHKRIVLAPNG